MKKLFFALLLAAAAAAWFAHKAHGQGLYIQQLTSTNGSMRFTPTNGGGLRVDLQVNAGTTNVVVYTNSALAGTFTNVFTNTTASVVYTNFALVGAYTNTSDIVDIVMCSAWLQSADLSTHDIGQITLMVSNAGWSGFSNTAAAGLAFGNLSQLLETNTLAAAVSNGGVYYFTNTSTNYFAGLAYGQILRFFNTVNFETNQVTFTQTNGVPFVITNSATNAFNPTFQDVRTMSNSEVIPVGDGGTNEVLFSNLGPGTITQIAFSSEDFDTNFYHNALIGPALRIIVDGVDRAHWIDQTEGHSHATNNGLNVLSFLCGDGFPSVANCAGTNMQFNQQALHGGNVEITACYSCGAANTFTALRNIYINFRTNCVIEITNAEDQPVYSDVNWRVGPPVTGTSWNALEVVNTNAGTNLFTGCSISNVTGQLESIYWFFADGGSFGYVTPPIMFDVDHWSYPIGKGTEDSFGGSWAWAGGYDRYDTPKWGTICYTGFTNTYWLHPDWYGGWPVSSGNTSWRYFALLPEPEPGVYFSTNFAWTFDPSDGIEQDYGIGLTTYYSIP